MEEVKKYRIVYHIQFTTDELPEAKMRELREKHGEDIDIVLHKLCCDCTSCELKNNVTIQ